MRITRTDTFKKCYKKLPREKKIKVVKQLSLLVKDPSHPSLNVHRIKGTGNIWECYIDKSYRLTFEKSSDELILRVVGPHDIIEKEAKKN